MNVKQKNSPRTLHDPDLPEITDDWIAGADLYHGQKLVRRGRPKLENPRQLLSLRLPPQIIERWKRLGNEIVVDVTMYDPKAFAFPWHEVVVHSPRKDWKSPPPVHNECVSTNNAYHNADGRIAEFAVGDPQYNNMFEPRPWSEVFKRTEEAKRAGRLPKATDFMGGTAAK